MSKKKKKKTYDKSVILGQGTVNVPSVPKTKAEVKQEKKEAAKEFKQKAKLRRQAQAAKKSKEKEKKSFLKRIGGYFVGVKNETKKVVWPTRIETFRYTITVLVACTFFALLFWVLDTTFLTMMQEIFSVEGLN